MPRRYSTSDRSHESLLNVTGIICGRARVGSCKFDLLHRTPGTLRPCRPSYNVWYFLVLYYKSRWHKRLRREEHGVQYSLWGG